MLFIVLGCGGLLWLLPWIRLMPRVERRMNATDAAALPSIAKLLRLKCAWGAFFGHFCGNYFFYFLLAWLPTYLVGEEKMSVGAMSRLTAAVFSVIATVTLATGWTSDKLIAAGYSATRVRRTAVIGGLSVASELAAARVYSSRSAAVYRCDFGGVCGVWGVRVEPLGDHSDVGWHADGRPMGEPAEWSCESFGDCGSVGFGFDYAGEREFADGVRDDGWSCARWGLLLGISGASR